MTGRKLLIGVLTYRNGAFIAGKTYLTRLALVAETYGCELVVYSPADICEEKNIVRGFAYDKKEKKWEAKKTRTPDIVYDRFSNMTPEIFKKYAAYRNKSRLVYLNSRFAHKWNAHQFFSGHSDIAPHLPETMRVQQGALGKLIRKYPVLYAKPVNGSGGKGIIRIQRKHEIFEMVGRDKTGCIIRNTIRSLPAAERYLLLWCQRQGRTFILQQGLDLALLPGFICDSRVLVQKNEVGQWIITGIVGKQSPQQLITSNLQSGGRAVPIKNLLTLRFSPEETESILQGIKQVSLLLPQHIESKFGSFIEFGIDIGIDTKGQIWIIEVNTKPNRELFRLAGLIETYKKAVEMPIRAAIHQISSPYL
ncbi:YheC/YheD family protein [Aneurinibacillus thermoaerophilus]|uniref:YheC/YheD family protein n=1 Tax=Aneurinibacillus thermoaerophilus TaxID=143495 RepID=A0ABX8YCH7_ANETH|nr:MULTISPECIES: YheC/YheD family protein [Aneurinibacillus]AMA73990.1 hypothetical protein ACH33_14860 [Aneurinibacillus sp. XH2]QYY43426.1 YheC/YheD family protein [Aneurinibacillus thermoaerophilus]